MKQVCCFMIWVALIRNIIYIFPSVTLRCLAELLWYIVGPHCCIFVSPYMFYNFIQKKCGVVERTNPVFYCLLEVWSWAIPLRVCVYIYLYLSSIYSAPTTCQHFAECWGYDSEQDGDKQSTYPAVAPSLTSDCSSLKQE